MKKRTGALLMALVMLFGLMAPAASAVETNDAVEAVYLGVKDFTTLDTDVTPEVDFVHLFAIDGETCGFTVATGEEEDYAIQNELMEGYIYNIVTADGVVTDVELQDKGTIEMGAVADMGDLSGKPVYEITTKVGGAVVTEIDAADLKANDTVKVTENAVYKAFVAEDYEAPVAGTPGETTLKNFLTTALQPVGTALYVYGGCWDWEDDASSPQSTTIGIPQEWVDFFQSNGTDYHYKKKDANGSYANSVYTSNRGWNQYYYAGVDCSAYVGWVVYNVQNTESGNEGYVMSSTNQASNFADLGWGTYDRGDYIMNADGTYYKDNGGDARRLFDIADFKVGDVFSDNGHAWICLGVCEDGSMVFMHSTPSNATEGAGEGGGIQISALDLEEREDCEAYKLACHYMETYYPQWTERYTPVVRGESYINVYDTGVPGTKGFKERKAGRFSWDLSGNGLLTDPDGYADMTPAEILADIFGEVSGEAVYMGLENFNEMNTKTTKEPEFVHQFFMDGEVVTFTIDGEEENFPIQNQLMEGYIYDITAALGEIKSVTLKDKGTIEMGAVADMGDLSGKPVYEITTQPGGATVTKIAALADTDTVKVTENAVYKTFVSEDYTAPADGYAGVTTLRNFLTTALEPVGTALYVYGGAWDWQDDVSSNQSMTIGIAQSWIDFFQAQDASYDFKFEDENGKAGLPSYYTSNRGWNQYYYAGVDCSAYTGWLVYNITNTEDSTVENNENGYVGSATKQAKNLAGKGWGTWNHDTAAVAAAGELKVGDIVSMSGHVWVVLGVCDDGSVVFMHSTPSNSRAGEPGGGIQIASLNPNGDDDYNCEAYKLADYYMSKYYPQWYDRYAISQKGYSYYLGTKDNANAGIFSWYLNGEEGSIMADPDGFADMKPAEILAAIFGESEDMVKTTEAVYLGVKNFNDLSASKKNPESTFIHQFAIDGVVADFMVEGSDPYVIQNQLMEGYIYNVTTTNGVITAVELLDKGTITMGTVTSADDDMIKVDSEKVALDKPIYEITTQPGGATVTAIDSLKKGDTVKITDNAIYKAFVAEEYTAPVAGTPGVKTLKNFITTALQPVGTALYVYGGAWDWQDDVSSNQSMTIGIPQSWVDFFQSQDTSYDFKYEDANGKAGLPSYYTSNRGWNQYYYAGVDCSAYTGWLVYNITNTEDSTVENNENGYVGSATKQAKNLAGKGWGTWNHDTAAVAAAGELKVGDIVSMSGHVWVVLGVCDDGSVVFMHSTPSNSRAGEPGGGIQIASLNPDGQSKTRCEAYKLADYYMSEYYPQWYERYAISQKSYTSYLGTSSNANAGIFSWYLNGEEGALLTDPDGYADMTPAEILMDIFGDDGVPAAPSSKPSIRDEADVVEPSAPVETATYTDVPETHWAYEAIEAVSEAGLFNGTSATTFSPEAHTTRGQLMTVLARKAGVKADTIADGVAWAVANGVSDGTGADEKVTREQLVTMLYRAAGSPAVTGDLSAYVDAASVSTWAQDAMTWAVANGIVNGMTETTLVPAGTATRAQIAAIMQRYAAL